MKKQVEEMVSKVIEAEDVFRVEDGGCAIIVDTPFHTSTLTLTSWDDECKHPYFEEEYKLFKSISK